MRRYHTSRMASVQSETPPELIKWMKDNPLPQPQHTESENACEVPYDWYDLKDMGKLQETYEWIDEKKDTCVACSPEGSDD